MAMGMMSLPDVKSRTEKEMTNMAIGMKSRYK